MSTTQLTEAQTVDVLRASVMNVACLLPDDMEIFVFREPGDPRVHIQLCMPDGDDMNFICERTTPVELVPFVHAMGGSAAEEG